MQGGLPTPATLTPTLLTTLVNSLDPMYVRRVADKLKARLTIRKHLFAVATSCPPGAPVPLLLVSSSHEFLQRAALLVSSKFAGRTLAGAQIGRAHV